MKGNDICPLVQDLLPLYDAGEVNADCQQMIAAHLTACPSCRAALDLCRQPLLDAETKKAIRESEPAPRFLRRLQRLGLIAVILFALAGSGLAWASYRAGQAITLRDPDFRRAIQEKLFTPVHQSQRVGQYNVTVERLLLDTTRTVVFYHVEPALTDHPLELRMEDDRGQDYEQRSSRGYHGRDFIAELAPVDPAAAKLKLSFAIPEAPARALFEVAVNPAAVQATTSELWPDVKLNLGELRLDVEHVLLGISRSQVDVRALWPLDKGIQGLGVGKAFLPAPLMEAGKPRSAAAGFFNAGPGEAPREEQAGLVDVTNRRELSLEGMEWQTDSTSGGIRAKFYFEPLAGATRELSLRLPPLYLYYTVSSPAIAKLDLGTVMGGSLNLNLQAGEVSLRLTGITREKNKLIVDYQLPGSGEGRWPLYLPGLVLVTPAGREISGHLQEVGPDGGRLVFYPDLSGDSATIKLKSLGKKLAEERELTIPVPTFE